MPAVIESEPAIEFVEQTIDPVEAEIAEPAELEAEPVEAKIVVAELVELEAEPEQVVEPIVAAPVLSVETQTEPEHEGIKSGKSIIFPLF